MAEQRRSLFIGPRAMTPVTGTWTPTVVDGVIRQVKSAAAETSTIHIPFQIPKRADTLGVKLNAVRAVMRITTADLSTAPSAVLSRINVNKVVAAAGVNQDLTTITTTFDGVVTAAATDRLWTVTVSSPVYETTAGSTLTDTAFQLVLTVPAAASTVVQIANVIVDYTESLPI